MTALYTALHDPNRGNLSQHVAWRASFAIVPVPILLGVAAAVLIFGVRPSLPAFHRRG
jgi:NNP family nitrate/nitrite transporter-like MFS transporter